MCFIVQDESISTASCMDVQCRRAGCMYPFYLSKLFLNAEMPDCPASRQSGTGMNKNADVGTSQIPDYRNPFRYRNADLPT